MTFGLDPVLLGVSPLFLRLAGAAAFFTACYALFCLAMAYGEWRTRRIAARIEQSTRIRTRVRSWVREQEALSSRQRSWW